MDFSGMTISGGVSIVPPPPGVKAIFGYGRAGATVYSITNLVSVSFKFTDGKFVPKAE